LLACLIASVKIGKVVERIMKAQNKDMIFCDLSRGSSERCWVDRVKPPESAL